MELTVCETFTSLLGESTLAGLPAFFIRLTGCNLRCRYCDTPYAYGGGETRSAAALVQEARDSGTRMVLITGGGTPAPGRHPGADLGSPWGRTHGAPGDR